MASFNIQLNGLRFFAHHGVYKEEAIIGNEFELNVAMEVDAPDEILTTINHTINYSTVYQIIQHIFSKREELLETVAMKLAEAIKNEFPSLKKISVQIIKLHPPIASFIGSVSVTYNKEFDL